jgi:sulfite exporter TauE/SafE
VTLLIAMLPVYLMGNLHCLGMCGPVAMLIGTSPYRGYYLLGRLISFTLAGTLAGAFGYVLASLLQPYHLSALISIGFGLSMVVIGVALFMGKNLILPGMQAVESKMGALLQQKGPLALFAFGFLTIALPCGQTLLVYSACALSGSIEVGTINGLAFALLTTPALVLAMQARRFVQSANRFYRPVVGGLALLVGTGAIVRGLINAGVFE